MTQGRTEIRYSKYDGGPILISISPDGNITVRTALMLDGIPVVIFEKSLPTPGFRALGLFERVEMLIESLEVSIEMGEASDREMDEAAANWTRFCRSIWRAFKDEEV